jgi:hypothetical protein
MRDSFETLTYTYRTDRWRSVVVFSNCWDDDWAECEPFEITTEICTYNYWDECTIRAVCSRINI